MIPTESEQRRRDEVAGRLLRFIAEDKRVSLPEFDRSVARPNDRFALVNVGLEPNEFAGTLGRFRYQFEGEEDLLHMIVTADEGEVSTRDGQTVASFVLKGVPPALIWMKVGEMSQHFYVGHDDLIGALVS